MNHIIIMHNEKILLWTKHTALLLLLINSKSKHILLVATQLHTYYHVCTTYIPHTNHVMHTDHPYTVNYGTIHRTRTTQELMYVCRMSCYYSTCFYCTILLSASQCEKNRKHCSWLLHVTIYARTAPTKIIYILVSQYFNSCRQQEITWYGRMVGSGKLAHTCIYVRAGA